MNITRSIPVTARSYLTAGIAAVGVGAIALAPVQAIPDQAVLVPPRVVSDVGAVLASSFDPITPWVDTITTSLDNVAALIGFAFEKPFPILSTVIGNLGTYLGEISSGNFGLILEQVADNIGKLITSPFNSGQVTDFPIGPEGSGDTAPIPAGTYLSETSPVEGNSPDLFKDALNQEMVPALFEDPCQIDGECGIWPTVASVSTFLNSYGSGVLLGLLGPVLSPVAALINSVTAIVDAIGTSDFLGALNELINIPANLVNGFLNGALLDLTPILGALGPDAPLDGVGLRLGGLISGPTPLNGSLRDPENPPTEFSGGTGFDSVYAVKDTGLGPIIFGGLPVGPIGSLIGMGQYLGEQLVVTRPEATAAQSAAAVEAAPVEVSAPSEVAVVDAPAAVTESAPAPVAVAEVADAVPAEPAVAEVTPVSVPAAGVDPAPQVQANADVTDAPTRAGARASRNASADTGAGTPKRSSRR